MKIIFESFSDYRLASSLLASNIDKKDEFEQLISLFTKANESLAKVALNNIKLTKAEKDVISNNLKLLWEKLDTYNDKNFESLMCNFSDVVAVAEHFEQQDLEFEID